jgi:hypothetical protein
MPVPLPPRDFGQIGPKEGERFPIFGCRSNIGRMVDLREARGDGKPSSFPPERGMVTVLQDVG